MTKLSMIVAMDEGYGIGMGNGLPWKSKDVPGDLKRFKELTLGKIVVMGRKTFESIGSKPLVNRFNLIISRTLEKKPGIWVARDFETAIFQATQIQQNFNFGDELMVLGGGEVYRQAIQVVDKIYLTIVKGKHPSDSFFPAEELKNFRVVEEEVLPTHSYCTFTRI